ncbi:MAG TPA: hypothetical protein VIK91_17265 [Nannocystis sp.]
MRTARLAAVFGLLPGCVQDHPAWLIDRPLPWGIVASVVQPGPYASGLVVPDDRVRAVALPLDTLELQALVVAPPDTPALPPPIWFACGVACLSDLPDLARVSACPSPLPLAREAPCRLGEGERIRLVLGGAFSGIPQRGEIPLLAVGSADPDLPSETCLERLAADPREDLGACLVQSRTLALGPPWKLVDVAPVLGALLFPELPPDIRDEPVDVHPVLRHIEVVRASPAGAHLLEAHDGDSVSVRPGERITLTAVYADDALQEFYRPIQIQTATGFQFEFVPAVERIQAQFGFTVRVDDFDPVWNAQTWRWVVPDVADPFDFHLYADDGREGRAVARLRFVPERDAP